jgi:hypothetical protein
VFVFAPIDVAADFRRRAVEVEIVLIECGDRLQPLDIEQREPTVRECNKGRAAEPLEDAVDLHGGNAEGVGEFGLRQRKPDRMILAQSNRPLPPYQLAHQISDAPRALRRASATCVRG